MMEYLKPGKEYYYFFSNGEFFNVDTVLSPFVELCVKDRGEKLVCYMSESAAESARIRARERILKYTDDCERYVFILNELDIASSPGHILERALDVFKFDCEVDGIEGTTY